MLQCLYPMQQIIVHHFFVSLMDDRNLIIRAQVAKVLFFLQIRDSIQVVLHQRCWCMHLHSFFPRSLLLIKSSRLTRSSFHLSLAFGSFSSAKSYLLRSFAPWSVIILNARLALPNDVALNTELKILLKIVNNNAIYFLPKLVRNQPNPPNQSSNG